MAHGLRRRPLRRFPGQPDVDAGRRRACRHLVAARVRRLAALALDGDRSRHERELHGLLERRSRGDAGAHGAGERIAGAGRVDRAARAPPAARCPRGSSTAPAAPRVSTTRAGRCPANVCSSVSLTIAMSNCPTTSGSIPLAGDGLTIAVAPSARAAAHGPLVRGARHLARAEPDGGPAGIRRAGQAVRPGQREDLILALRVDRDQRHAAVHPGDHGERRDVDALVGQRAADELAELVVAARAEEAHAPRRGGPPRRRRWRPCRRARAGSGRRAPTRPGAAAAARSRTCRR